MNCAGYIRVSTEEAAEHGHSLDAQRQAILSYAEQRGWQVVEIYEDAGISGTLSDRPALLRLLDDAARGRFQALVVHAIDRFYRNLQGLLKALNQLHRHEVGFISLTENMDFTTPWGKLALAVLGTLAEIYIDRLSAETRKGKRARARKGLYNGSIPLGYCKGECSDCSDPNGEGYCPRYGGSDLNTEPDCPLVVHPIEGEAVRLAYEWYASGSCSDGQVAEKLNAYQHILPNGSTVGFRSKGRHGRSDPGPFSKDSVRDLLQRLFYTGVVPYYGLDAQGRKRKRSDPAAVFEGQHPAILSDALFQRCQEVRALMRHHPRRHPNYTQRLYLLSGILRCASCKRKMRAQSGNGVRYYQDTTRLQHIAPCEQPMVRAEEIEEKAAQILMDLEVPDDWAERALAYVCAADEIEQVEEKEREIREQLMRLRRLFIEGDIDYETYEQEKHQRHRQLADLRPGEYSAIMASAKEIEEFEELWHTSTMLDKKRLLQAHLTAVLIQGETIEAVQPTLVSYPLFQHQEARRRKSGSDGPPQFLDILHPPPVSSAVNIVP